MSQDNSQPTHPNAVSLPFDKALQSDSTSAIGTAKPDMVTELPANAKPCTLTGEMIEPYGNGDSSDNDSLDFRLITYRQVTTGLYRPRISLVSAATVSSALVGLANDPILTDSDKMCDAIATPTTDGLGGDYKILDGVADKSPAALWVKDWHGEEHWLLEIDDNGNALHASMN